MIEKEENKKLNINLIGCKLKYYVMVVHRYIEDR